MCIIMDLGLVRFALRTCVVLFVFRVLCGVLFGVCCVLIVLL